MGSDARLVPPSAMTDQPIGIREVYEAGRRYGRHEADNAITWMTSCLRCADDLDHHADGYFKGERSGLAAALRAVEESTSSEPEIQSTIDVIKAKVARLLDGYPEEGQECTPARAT